MRLFLLLFFLVIRALTITAQNSETRTCYLPDGTAIGPGASPCNTSLKNAACCATGETCISNGLCFGSEVGMMYRGGCTDQSWEDSVCPQVCQGCKFAEQLQMATQELTVEIDRTSGWANIWKCPMPYEQDQYWCGDDSSTLCENDTFSYPMGSIQSIAGEADMAVNANASASCDTESGARCPQDMTSSRVLVGVDMGIGIPLVIMVVGFGSLFVGERKKRKEIEKTLRYMSRSRSNSEEAKVEKAIATERVYELDTERVHEIDGLARSEIPSSGGAGRWSISRAPRDEHSRQYR
ncbi:hypothetical protein NA57DRAFT_57971 [Rhizodiscina lignyota]|uniref:Uncharacterized protein n=1 Tax=Rhizodiscina lignyota TaxID=1504668 RepID=A0A9P4IFR7_9PEZI|nr:hypothetical protein NA57DRAFT_57971 [Rhizodiscina lignyota]